MVNYLNPLPKEGERVRVYYEHSHNDNVWFIDNKFVNCYGFEMYNILRWEPLKITQQQLSATKADR